MPVRASAFSIIVDLISAPIPKPKYWQPLAAALALFLLNAYICHELFHIEFIRNLDSNEGAFIALSRFFRENFADQRWFPLFNGGVPIENAYQPLLPIVAALTSRLASGWTIQHAFHFVLAMAYCLGPVTLFCFAWEWSESLPCALAAGLAYSLTSFAELLIPILRVTSDGHWVPLRLYNLIHYAEDPHNLALTLLPVALLCLKRAITHRSGFTVIAAVLSCAAVVLSNAFGAVDLALGGICIALALDGGFLTVVLVGTAAWLLSSPWLPPSLLGLLAGDQWGARGLFHFGLSTVLATALVLAAFFALWHLTRRLRLFERFSILFAPWVCAFPMGHFLFGVSLVPQGNRYQLELELVLCLVAAILCARLFENLPAAGRVVLMLAILLFGVRQAKAYRHYARTLIQPVEITQTIEYKIVQWLNTNLPGQRTMISGDVQFLNNALYNTPQLGGGHEPTVPNWMNLVALYEVNTGDGAGELDGETSVFWLKAFGVQAVTVSGEKSREHYHPTRHPHKFDGLLTALWHEEDDTIFAIPQRSRSLAHVVPKAALATRRPLHGVDLDPVRAYVAALDDTTLPIAQLTWQGNSRLTVRAPVQPGQVLSVQINYAPGWHAQVKGRAVPVYSDAIGLMVVEPGCQGPCTVEMSYGLSTEALICRILSGLVTLWLLVLAIMSALATGISGAVRRAQSRPPLPH